MNRMLPQDLQERFFRLISGGFSLVRATRDEEDPGELGERIGATVREHQAPADGVRNGLCDWYEGDPHCHPNPVTALRGPLRKFSIILSILDTQHRSSSEVKDHLFGGTAGFYLDFTFHVCEVKTTSLVAPVDFILTSLFHACVNL